MRLLLSAALVLSLLGCAGGPGRLDPRLLGEVHRLAQVRKLELRLGDGGEVRQLAVLHQQRQRAPEAVLRLLEERLPGATVVELELERHAEHGWEHELLVRTADGRHCELAATPEGTFLYLECEVAIGALPQAITEAAARLAPGATLSKAETLEAPDRRQIAVELRRGAATQILVFSPGGELVAQLAKVQGRIEIPLP